VLCPDPQSWHVVPSMAWTATVQLEAPPDVEPPDEPPVPPELVVVPVGTSARAGEATEKRATANETSTKERMPMKPSS
jgi:hypothetical protein